MKRIFMVLARMVLKIIIYTYYGLLSLRDSIKTKKYNNIKIQKEYNGGKVMLLALYEKKQLRNDTLELLKAARKENVFVIAVNTLKLEQVNYPSDLVDVYIERDNYGRDFGSYKSGMSYFIDKKMDATCERLLIINDSVFFSKLGLDEFIHTLFNSEIEVLGSTENSQHSHHLGSFCISVAGKITREDKFKAFWQDYKLSNVRPLVIKRGEFGLSKVLKSLTSSEQHFKSLYNVSFMEKKLSTDHDFLADYYYYRREGESSWHNKSVTSIVEKDEVLLSYYNAYVTEKEMEPRALLASSVETNTFLRNDGSKKKEVDTLDYLTVVEFLKSNNDTSSRYALQFRQRLIGIYLNEFTLGSQIHINCLALHHCGLPIIKLDLIFRCVCNINDIIKLRDQLHESQQEEFMTLMLSRLCGDKFLVGINRLAYQFGIL